MKFRLRYVIISILIVLYTSFSGCGRNYSSQPFFIEASVDTVNATIGDVINFQVWAKGSGQRRVSFGPWEIDSSLIQIRSQKQLSGDHRDETGIQFEIALWDTGLVKLPAFPVSVTLAGEERPVTLKTDPIFIMVESLIPGSGSAGLRPIKGPVAIPIIMPWKALILIILLLGLVIVAVLIWRKRINNQSDIIQAEIPTEPADLIASAKIEQLKQKKLWEKGFYKDFYFELTFLLREYVENSLYIKTLEMTTEEIRINQDLLPFRNDITVKWLDLLNRADLIKFARQIPTGEICLSDLKSAEEFITDTVGYWKSATARENLDSKFESTTS